MKKVFSLILLLTISFLLFELLVNLFTKSYTNNYVVYSGDNKFNIIEKYDKNINDKYNLKISINDKEFYYIVPNNFNKQKKIIKDILIYENSNDICIYPILKDDTGTYIECNSNGNLYASTSYQDSSFIKEIKEDLKIKKYLIDSNIEKSLENYTGIKVYKKNINSKDNIVLWNYKGIDSFNANKISSNKPLSFDKYDNKTGSLVGKYYIIPNYTNSNILEFSSIYIIDITTLKNEKMDLGYTLSSDTYINGVVDNKLYYTDPSNLLQIEINPRNKISRLIGSEKLGGQMYDGKWKDKNIYDFRNNKIIYTNLNELSNYNYKEARVGDSSYYYIDSNNNVYQVLKGYLDKKILLFKSELNNFNVVSDDIYYVNKDTLYYFNIAEGIRPILINKDLIYNTYNRISIYRDYSS